MPNNKDIEELQTLIAHQANEIAELNDVVTKQWEQIDGLKKYMQSTKSKIQEIEMNINEIGGGEGASVSDEAAANKPPHY